MYKLIRREYAVFLDWIYYHEVLAEFTIRHWKAPYDGCGFVPLVRSAGLLDESGFESSGVIIDILIYVGGLVS